MSGDLVIGGGLAGSSAAILLARAGREVTLVEREAGPHDKVCGEFLSGEAVEALQRLGLDVRALGARAIRRLEIEGARGCDLPFVACSLSRRVLDEALLQIAEASGAVVIRGLRIAALAREAGGWTAQAADGRVLRGARTFLATGKHDLRSHGRRNGRQTDLIGFKLHLRTDRAAAGVVSLHLFPGGYAGFQPVEGGRANLCLVVRRDAYSRIGGSWPSLVAHLARFQPELDSRIGGAAEMKPLAAFAIPYGHVAVEDDGLWRLGDQAAVIPSFLGEGMAIALRSAELAADHALRDGSPAAFQLALARQVSARVGLSTLLSQALVRPQGQAVARLALNAAPGLGREIARWSRLPATSSALAY